MRDLGKHGKEAELAGDDSRQVDPHTLGCMKMHSVCIGRLVLARDWFSNITRSGCVEGRGGCL